MLKILICCVLLSFPSLLHSCEGESGARHKKIIKDLEEQVKQVNIQTHKVKELRKEMLSVTASLEYLTNNLDSIKPEKVKELISIYREFDLNTHKLDEMLRDLIRNL